MAQSRLLSPIIVADQKELRDLVIEAGQSADNAAASETVATTQAGIATDEAASAGVSKNQAAAYASAADSAADRAEAVVVSGDVSFYPAPGKVPVARSTGQIDANWIKGIQRPAQWLENVSGATGAPFPDESEAKMTPQQMLVFDPVFIPAALNGEITLFSDGVMGVYITDDKKIRLNYYGAFETTQTISVSDDFVDIAIVSDDNEQDTVSVFFLVNGVQFDIVQVGEFSPIAMRDVLGATGFRWLFNPGMEYLTNANINRVTLPGQAIGTVRDIGPNGLNGSQLTATARPLAGRVPVGGRRNLLLNTDYAGYASTIVGIKQRNVDRIYEELLVDEGVSITTSGTSSAQYTYAPSVGAGDLDAVAYSDEFKASGCNTIRLMMASNLGMTSNIRSVTVSLVDGSVIDSAGGSDLLGISVTNKGDGWFRIGFVANRGPSTIIGFRIGNSEAVVSDGYIGVLRRRVQYEISPIVTPYQRVGATARDITEPGVPDVHYAYFDGNDDVISMTLPSAITGGTIIVAGLNGIYVDDNFSASAGAFNVGPTTYTGGPAGLLAATGSPIGVTVVDGQLTPAELEQERKFYIQNGAPDVPVVI